MEIHNNCKNAQTILKILRKIEIKYTNNIVSIKSAHDSKL